MLIIENNHRKENFRAKDSSSSLSIRYSLVFHNRLFYIMKILLNSILNQKFTGDIVNRRIMDIVVVDHSNHHQSRKYHHCYHYSSSSSLSHSSSSANYLTSIKMSNMLNIILIILVMMISSSSFRTSAIVTAASESKSDTFNIDKLLEYNELVSFFSVVVVVQVHSHKILMS